MAKRPRIDEYLFVDGYNIINSWDIFEVMRSEKLEESRDYLKNILVEYSAYSGIKIILVFDAHLVKGNSGTVERVNGLKIVYTQELETADHYIERSITKLARKKRVRVATSDKLEQEIILSRGATRLSARELKDEIFTSRMLVEKSRLVKNQQNDYHFGGLDEKNKNRLEKYLKKNN